MSVQLTPRQLAAMCVFNDVRHVIEVASYHHSELDEDTAASTIFAFGVAMLVARHGRIVGADSAAIDLAHETATTLIQQHCDGLRGERA